MDTNSSLFGGGMVATAVLVAGIVYKAINHKHIRSKCCGKAMDMSIDIDDSTPAPTTIKVVEPIASIKVPSERKKTITECPPPPKPSPSSHPSDQS